MMENRGSGIPFRPNCRLVLRGGVKFPSVIEMFAGSVNADTDDAVRHTEIDSNERVTFILACVMSQESRRVVWRSSA